MKRPRGPAPRAGRLIAGRWGGVWVLWSWHKWRGLSLPSWVRPGDRTWLSVTGFTDEERLSVKRPDLNSESADGRGVDLPASKCLTRFERVADLLQVSAWDDGTAKGDRCLMFFASGPTIRVLAKVASPPLKLSAVGRSFDESLASLEALLGASDVPWEQDLSPRPEPRRKPK